MSTSEIITIIVGSIGGSAALFAVLGFLARSIVVHLLSRDIEKFKLDLQHESQKEMARLQSSLDKCAFEHQTRFGQLHKLRAQVIADIYSKLYEFYWAACSFLRCYHGSDDTQKSNLLKKLEEDREDFTDFFDKHRIYFSGETCSLVDQLAHSLDRAYIPLAMCVEGSRRANRQIQEDWQKSAQIIQKEFPKIKSSLESSFRSLLGVDQLS